MVYFLNGKSVSPENARNAEVEIYYFGNGTLCVGVTPTINIIVNAVGITGGLKVMTHKKEE